MSFVILNFQTKIGSLGLGRGLKSFVEVLRFVVTEYRGVGSHGDPIRDQNCVLENIWETSGGHIGDIWRSYGGHLGDLGLQGDPKSDLRVRAFKSVTPLG